MTRNSSLARAGVVGLLLAAGLLVQVWFLRSYPQPVLFGDPEAYYVVGRKLRQAMAAVASGTPLSAAFGGVKDYLYFGGVGALFAVMDALFPGDLPRMRLLLATFNTLGMLGAFRLARALGGSWLGGVLALAAAAVYPSFSVQTGRLFPEPVVGCLFVWSAVLFLAGAERRRPGLMALSGLTLVAGLFIRSQLMTFMTVVLAGALVASAAAWARQAQRRRLVGAFVLGALPVLAVWIGITQVASVREVERFGFFTFQQRYPYGFWMFRDADGFIGPYRMGTYPFYKEMEAASAGDPELMTSRTRQLLFTARYLLRQPVASASLLVENLYRLYDRPANDFKWDYPFPDTAQVGFQHVVMVLGLAGLATFATLRPAVGAVSFVPLALLVICALSFPRPRYGQPAMLIWMAFAGAFAGALWEWHRSATARIRVTRVAGLLAAALGLGLLGLALRSAWPAVARLATSASWLTLVSVPFVAAWSVLEGRSRRLLVATGAALAAVVSLHLARGDRWHETSLELSASHGVEQRIELAEQALDRLRRASEAFLVLDLRAEPGALRSAELEVAGRRHAGSDLAPTIPRIGLAEATSAGGRDPRSYRQWWALPLSDELRRSLSPGALVVRLTAGADPIVLYGDRFAGQERRYEGPSFGDWPRLSTAKLEYDGDYRLPLRRPLSSAGTRSARLDAGGPRREVAEVYRIRLVTLDANEGALVWEQPAAPSACYAFRAYSGTRGEAEFSLGGTPPVRFPLGAREPFQRPGAGLRLCHRPEPSKDMALGAYAAVPEGVTAAEGPVRAAVRFRSGMSIEPLFFSLQAEGPADALAGLCAECAGGRGIATVTRYRLLDAGANSYPPEGDGGWRVAEVF